MTILIVEDDKAITYVLKEYFAQTGRSCISTPSVGATLLALSHTSPRTVLLDFLLEDGDAVPIIIALKGNGRHEACKIILMTASHRADSICETYDLPCVLKKPFDFSDLEAAIN